MARPIRLDIPGLTQHVVQRGVDRRPCFLLDIHYQAYLRALAEYAAWTDCEIHAYVLMCNHVHLLVTPATEGGVGKMMQAINRKFVGFVNFSLDRTGPLWGGRYKSCTVGTDDYALACYRYIEMNPVRAGIVDAPSQYRWSSHLANAFGKADPIVRPHDAYSALGQSTDDRCSAYLSWVLSRIGHEDEARIREVTNRQHAFGDQDFCLELERDHRRTMTRARIGRPRKSESSPT